MPEPHLHLLRAEAARRRATERTDEHERDFDATVVAALTEEPRSATAIFLAIEGLHENKSLTTALRKRRRAVAKRLERLAEEGRIRRQLGTEPPIPLYSRG